jgi:5-methylcytosine-specific restriction enzyme subunit McrC
MKLTSSYSSYYSINKILSHIEEVSTSSNIKGDLAKVQSSNRLLSKYKMLLLWSEIFLTNKSFTNFKGDNLNMAILYPMERIFEDYIAHLFTKYSEGYRIKLQDKSYFLINHRTNNLGVKIEKQIFGLKPDIVINKDKARTKIVDTKWKLLNQFAEKRNYDISQADMYQLYAYGKKYSTDKIDPKLILLYPTNPNFSNKLDNFIYEGELALEVIPFDFVGDEKRQIEFILNDIGQ